MSNSSPAPHDADLPPEVDFTDAVRGKHFAAYWRGRTPITLDPDLAAAFPTAQSVNDALRAYQKLQAQRRTG